MNKTENKIHVIKERSKVIFEIPKIITPPYQYDYTTRQVVAQSIFLGLYIIWCIYHIINFINNTVVTVSRSININASAIVMPVISCGIITIGIYVQLIIVVILNNFYVRGFFFSFMLNDASDYI